MFESYLYREISGYFRMDPLQSILFITVISYNPQANLLSRHSKTLLDSRYVVEKTVFRILAQPISKNIESSIFYEFDLESPENTYPKLEDFWTQYLMNGLIDCVETFCRRITQ